MGTKKGGKKYVEPDELFQHFVDYVEHERQNPMYKREYVGKDGTEKETPLQVPITFEGFECYLADKNILQDLGEYSANTNGNYDDYSTIIARIKNNCFVQNFKGASVGLFNANIIARKLNLKEKTENENTSTNVNILSVDPMDNGKED